MSEMSSRKLRTIELLAPAKNYEQGRAAILCGADALYVGAPRFGARSAAGVPEEEIVRLCDLAHRFGAKVYVAMNTLLYEQELADAERIACRMWNAGADALIVQDMAFLRMELPPVELHASTQVCNTDPQALRNSPVPVKVRLGQNGLGAGNNPEKGRQAALESLDEIIEIYKREGTKMVFITAGMGGGTGTGAAPVIARAAKELGILTVAIVTLPFKTEGPKRMRQAQQGIEELRGCVDSLLLINNENIQEIFGKLTLTEAFGKADDILATAARGIAEVITRENTVNVDFADVQTVMSDSGVALMGSGRASGEDRAMKVANMALESPLLNHNDIAGAKNILINITSGDEEITLEETYMITEYIQERAGNNADIIWGAGKDDALGQDIEVTIIATGFDYAQMNMVSYSPLQDYKDSLRKANVRGESENDAVAGEPVVESPEPAEKPAFVPHEPSVRPVSAAPGGQPDAARRIVPNRPVPVPPRPQPKPFSAPVSQPAIESKKDEGSDIDIEELENRPAFVRRNIKFVKDTSAEGNRSARVVLKDDSAQQSDKGQSSSLFD